MNNLLNILRQRPFLSVFLTQFFGAFNDNLFRSSMVAFITYKLTTIAPSDKEIIVTLAMGLFMLPFFLFSATAGEIADKIRKDLMFKITKMIEVGIVTIGVLGFYFNNPYLLLIVLTLMGTQSAFFGPAKYSILPDVLKKNEIIAGNAIFEAGTYLAILSGIIIGGVIMSGSGTGLVAVSFWICSVAIIGLVASFFIPKIPAVAPETKISPNFLKTTWNNMKFATIKREIFLCILGISWFWLVGAVIISQIPNYSEKVLNGTTGVYTLLLTLFSCGVGIGAIACQMLLKGEITSKYLPITAILMTVFLGDLAMASLNIEPTATKLSIIEFVSSIRGFRISFDILMLAGCGGMFMVPLNAMLQTLSSYKVRSRVIATNNIINALFMVIGSGICALLLSKGVAISGIFVVLAIANAVVTVYICGLLPEHLVRALAKKIVNMIYKVEIRGAENLEKLKGKTVIIANHTSFLDAILLWVYLPENVFYAINTYVAKVWWIRPLLHLTRYVTLDPTSSMSVKSIVDEVKKGRRVAIFPEGRITTTGTLMKVYPGPAMIADKTNADILPIYIEGSQYSVFARFSENFKKRPKSEIIMNILPPRKLNVDKNLVGKKRRLESAKKLYDLMCEMKFKTQNFNNSLFKSLVDASKLVGKNKLIIEDTARKPISYKKLIIGILALGKKLKQKTESKEFVGLMLPNSIGVAVAFFGLSIYRRTPCMINFSSGIKNIISACKVSKIKQICTSREFIKKAQMENLIVALENEEIKMIYLEDVKSEITFMDKIKAMYKSCNPLKYVSKVSSNDPAVVLFTSGSEGVPKGVVLSHSNINANRCQIASIAPFGIMDKVFNAMPVFHSFGITAGLMLPLLSGLKVFMYPTPLHYRIVPEMIYDTDSTVMFGTDTFFNGYAKSAHPYDFHTIRFAVAGAEKVKDETHRVWSDTFGVRLLEGYGATETAPVLSVNMPMNYKRGSVGRLLPDIEYKLEKIVGIEDGGKLIVKGPNIMLGYLTEAKPGKIVPLDKGWYDTGDIVDIDEQGFITIKGRAKRFAKIAGEMVSLSAVETEVSKVWKEFENAVVAIPDEKRGEQIVLFTNNKNATRDELQEAFKSSGISEISTPRAIKILDSLPLMGSGKIDYVKLNEIALGE